MIDIVEITCVQREMIVRWHAEPVAVAREGLLGIIGQQLSYNFLLWHEEDIARSREVTDARIAEVKRAIDRLNQQRNDWIEKIDDWITDDLARRGVAPAAAARQNTETAGSVIDRLAILGLRIYHLEEQRDRPGAADEHRQNASRKLAIAIAQSADLSRSAQELLDDIYAGRKRHKTYRQLKLYNDPTMNPYLYNAPGASP